VRTWTFRRWTGGDPSADRESIAEKARDRSAWYKTIAAKVDAETAEKVRAFKNEHGLNGVKIETDTKRYYPGGSLAAHVIGFVGTETAACQASRPLQHRPSPV
jgi:cell division protein FtsI/penicillin-binding protein 2